MFADPATPDPLSRKNGRQLILIFRVCKARDILNQGVDGCLSPNALMIDDCGDVIISALPPSLLRKDTKKVSRQKGWSQLGYIPTIQTREAR